MFNRSSTASFSTGGSSAGQAGFPVPESGVITIPTDYATLTAAFEAIDAAGGVFGNRKLTIQLPDTNGTPIEEYFHWDNMDYSNIILKGAEPVISIVDFSGGFSNLSGTAGDYRFTVAVDPSVASAAAIAGYATIYNTNSDILNVDPEINVLGTWEVESTTTNTVTVICTHQGTISALPADFSFMLDVFVCVFPTVLVSTSSTTIFSLDNGAKSPKISNIMLLGDGTQKLIHAKNSSEITVLQGVNITQPLVCFGGSVGIALQTGSKFSGSVSISCGVNGFYAQQSDYYFDYVTVSGHSSWGSFASDGSSITVSLGGIFTGNAGFGIHFFRHSNGTFIYGSLIGNTNTDIQASDLSFVRVFSSAYTLVGTSSPAFNVSGNTESHVMRG